MKTKLLALAGFALCSLSNLAAPAISTTVNGVPNTVIGTLDASIPDPVNKPRNILAEFLFADDMGFLDDCYDFTFLNIERQYFVNGIEQVTDPVVGTLPAIDPQPKGAEDDLPYYFTQAEYDATVFNGVTIKDDGVGARFTDAPNDGTKISLIEFKSYLVAIDDWEEETVYLLGWFNWTYKQEMVAGNLVKTSSVGTVSSVLNAGDVSLVTSALNNAVDGNDINIWEGWSVELYPNLECVPEPGAMVGAVVICIFIGAQVCRRRRVMA